MSRQAPGGNSTFSFSNEPVATPASVAAPVAAAPAPAPVAAPVEEAIPSGDLEALKLKAISKLTALNKLSPDVASIIGDFIKKLDATGCTARTITAVSVDASLERLKEILKARGTHGILSLGRKFASMDDNGNKQLCFQEYSKAMAELKLPESDIHCLFRYFDADCNGNLSYDELLVGLRGQLNERRLDMVQRAFKVLDKTGDGAITLDDLKGRYDASKHPDVILGTKTPDQVVREMMEVFEAQGGGNKGDGTITFDEFKKYYQAISASVDLDDYFELMIRNAWHISGGEGWCANTTCKRVLVLHEDGTQGVYEIENDLDLTRDQYLGKLKEQGVTNIKSIALYGQPDDVPDAAPSPAPATVPAAGTPGPTSPSAATPGSGRFAQMKKGGADHFRSSIMFG